jgi:hypothetical protein
MRFHDGVMLAQIEIAFRVGQNQGCIKLIVNESTLWEISCVPTMCLLSVTGTCNSPLSTIFGGPTTAKNRTANDFPAARLRLTAIYRAIRQQIAHFMISRATTYTGNQLSRESYHLIINIRVLHNLQ